ncbi:MAG: exodeoxyribonuclease V subunit beta [Rubrivivax sp.]|nr:exodeoxyribonuclease V subunit beta [Rubrivivax sp.]
MSPAVQAFDAFAGDLGGLRLIEASAGTGKTWNLCVLYLRLLLERRLPVREILVVTFTNAATAELRERIRSRIADTLARLRGTGPAGADPFVDPLLARLRGPCAMRDDELMRHLELALHSFDEASILTIHGFCQRALAELPFTAGMPMQLSLLADDGSLRQDVVHDFWRRRIASAALSPELAAHLIDRKFTPARLGELLARRLGKPWAVQRWPDTLDAPPARPDPAALDAAYAAARALWQAERGAIVEAVWQAQPVMHKTHFTTPALRRAIESWDQLLAPATPPLSGAGLPGLELLGAARFKPTKGQTLPVDHAFFASAQALLDRLQSRQAALEPQRLRLLRELLDDGPAALRRAKLEQRVLGFDDMLLNLHDRLAGPGGAALARLLRQRFSAALIDEFQDTDPLQYAIFHALYGGSNAPVFLVGDPKQAIYGFRHADLHTYLQARAEAAAEYTLSQNQRSTRELLDGLNALFGANPQAFMQDGLHYQAVSCGAKPRTPLHEPAAPPRAALQLWQLPRGDDGQPLPKAEAMNRALAACAAEIARLLSAAAAGEVRLGERPLSAGDIAVLVRSHAQGAAMRRALAALGVGSVELSQASVYDSSDAADVERVLAATLEPQREPLLRAALATQAMGRDAAALQRLDDDEGTLLALMARFAGYRDTWLAQGVGRMLREWMRAEGVAARLLARPDGERRLTNLMHLAECLHEAAQAHPAPEALLRWLQAQRGQERRDDSVQLRLESDRHLVQVVTIHKSKGLEYPLVFCPVLWDGHPGRPPTGEGLQYHDAEGHAVIDFRALDKAEVDELKRRQALEGAAEAMRLIYVALTRAVHRCTVVVGGYTTHRGQSHTESTRSRLNWLAAGAGLSPQAWLSHKLTPQAIDAAWAVLAQAHAPALRLDPLPAATGQPLAPQPLPAEPLAALAPPAHIPAPWWIGSYSSLTHGARHDGAAVDHDLRVAAAADDDAAAVDADDILHFPRGAVAGECLHAVFERIDFGDAAGWQGAVDAVLQRFTPGLPPGDAALRRRMLLRMLHDVLHTPLAGGLRLADVPRAHTLVELEFHLPSPQLHAEALARLMRRLGHAQPAFGFGTLRGYLRGFIDLVFEHQGRYFVLDWKSNHLGHTPVDYGAAALERTMAQQGYHLQALIYALALHRHLQQRLPQYRHEQHFGGVLYLFVRGVRPGWTLADGRPAGVHLQRPTLAALQALSALLDGEEQAA